MEPQRAWWRTFFTGNVVAGWLAATTDEQTATEADFIAEELGVSPPARLLDVPCGGGRHCHALAARGYEMTGVDVSPEFLAAARSRSGERSGSITWDQREMRELPWQGEFDGAFSFGNSFGYDDDEGNADFLKAVARALKPGARFILDTGYIMETLLPSLQVHTWYEAGDILVLADRRFDPTMSRLHVEYRWIQAGSVDRRSMSARLYSYREILGLFHDAGFVAVQGYGSIAREPFGLGAKGLVAMATKKGNG
jgi:SAM-dependent methyltransferase